MSVSVFLKVSMETEKQQDAQPPRTPLLETEIFCASRARDYALYVAASTIAVAKWSF